MEPNNLINPQDCNYLNIPLSIIDQRWYKSEKAVRAWFFYAWQSLLPHWEEHRTKVIKGKTFHLTEGEMICTRSYLAKSLGITDDAAKGNTDKLKRTNTIKVTQEILSKDIVKAPKNKLSRIIVDGVPVPNEPYLKTVIPVQTASMWQSVGLAQLYIYIMCRAEHKETYAIGVGGVGVKLQPGDLVISYKDLMDALRCKEGNLKKNLKTLESVGAITRQRLGNKGILIHLNYYPERKCAEVKIEVKDTKVEELLEQTTKPAKCQNVNDNKVIDKVAEPTEKVVSQQPQNVVSPTPSPQCKPSTTVQEPASQYAEIHDTPVTDAIKYLFFGKKGNKDIGHLNQVIDYVNDNLPVGFPMDKLVKAMDAYYDEHGEKYIDKITLVKSINKFYGQIKKNIQAQTEVSRKVKKLESERAQIHQEYDKFKIRWRNVALAYKDIREQNKEITTMEVEIVNDVFITLWSSNQREDYIDKETLPKISIGADYRKKCDYICAFLSRFENYEALCQMYKKEHILKCNECKKKTDEINAELARFKTAV